MVPVSSIAPTILKDERKIMITNAVGIPLVMSLHLFAKSPWTPALIAAVGMNMAYLEASVKTLFDKSGKDKTSKNHLPVELPASICMIGMAVYGYTQDQPLAIVATIVLHGFWDMAKHTCGVGVPFFGWYLSGCAIFDVVYGGIMTAYYYNHATLEGGGE